MSTASVPVGAFLSELETFWDVLCIINPLVGVKGEASLQVYLVNKCFGASKETSSGSCLLSHARRLQQYRLEWANKNVNQSRRIEPIETLQYQLERRG